MERSRGGHPEVMRMAGKERRNGNKKSSSNRRMTPYDKRIEGTLGQEPRPEKAPPRGPTPEETRANNEAMVDLGFEMAKRFRLVIQGFRDELDSMNKGKRGRPYLFTESLIELMQDFRSMGDSTFRFVAGFVNGILGWFGLSGPSYARLAERVCESAVSRYGDPEENERKYGKGVYAIVVPDNDTSRKRDVGLDGTGLSLSNHNRWRSAKWGAGPKTRGWLHGHIASDLDSTELLAIAITDSSVGDVTMLKPVVNALLDKDIEISRFFGDGAYGASDEVWKFLTMEKGLEFVSSFKSNTVPKNNGCPARGRAARMWCSMTYHQYAKETGYSKRWKSEGEMSDFKEIFPETVTARTKRGVVAQIASRAQMFNKYKVLRAKKMGITGNGVVIA